jgi:hypothetical protein
MVVYGQTKCIVMPFGCFCFVFALVQPVVPLCSQRPLTQLIPAAWDGHLDHCSVYLSKMSVMNLFHVKILNDFQK